MAFYAWITSLILSIWQGIISFSCVIDVEEEEKVVFCFLKNEGCWQLHVVSGATNENKISRQLELIKPLQMIEEFAF